MTRVRYAALALGALLAGPAHAVDVPRPPAPPDRVEVTEPHRYSIIEQGLVGAAGGVLALTGVALITHSYSRYVTDTNGGDGTSCRPCSSGQVNSLRIEYGVGFGLIGVGAVLFLTTGILAKLDWDYRHDHMREAKVELTPTGLRF